MQLAKGIYLAPALYKFNFNILLRRKGVKHKKAKILNEVLNKETLGFGVCDSYEQILEHFPSLITSDKKYIVALSKVTKGIEGTPYGWRWHKWGPYIGTQKPTTEYLYDEPNIDTVYTFTILEILD